jgi:hypothetical protein
MTPAAIDRVFGRGRLRMVTGDHVEVFREESQPSERRRYTKRFLATPAGDFRQWTEREWRILARLVGHGIGPVPDVVQFDRGASGRQALVQTYDAGVTIDHWTTLLPVQRDGETRAHVFEDCAHWWALARHSLVALDAIHDLHLVHLDLKADNVCIPVGPVDFDPEVSGARLFPDFERIALIDFAFSLVSGERLDSALPIARQTEFDYQSPRLLAALEEGSRGNLWRPAFSTGAATCSARGDAASARARAGRRLRLDRRASRAGAGAGAPPARGPRRRVAGGAAACRAHRRDRGRAARFRARRFAAARLAARRAQPRRERRFADAGHPHRAASPCRSARCASSTAAGVAVDPSDVEGWAAAIRRRRGPDRGGAGSPASPAWPRRRRPCPCSARLGGRGANAASRRRRSRRRRRFASRRRSASPRRGSTRRATRRRKSVRSTPGLRRAGRWRPPLRPPWWRPPWRPPRAPSRQPPRVRRWRRRARPRLRRRERSRRYRAPPRKGDNAGPAVVRAPERQQRPSGRRVAPRRRRSAKCRRRRRRRSTGHSAAAGGGEPVTVRPTHFR